MLHQIGVGALGPVFRTYEPTRDRLVAVKVFRLDVTPEQSQALADEMAVAAEAGLFHPSIVEPIASGIEGTLAYRAEEYVAAESLDVAMRHYAPAPIEKVLPFITQLAGAVDFARTSGIGHGALHPRDVFVTPDEARATGFGVVEALERVGLRAPVRRPYSAPERVAGELWSTPADVFSLGVIAYEMLTGRRPAGTGAQIGPVSGDGSDAVHAVLAQALDDDPARRFPTALAFAAALEAASRGDVPGVPSGPVQVAAPLPVQVGDEPLFEDRVDDSLAQMPPLTDLDVKEDPVVAFDDIAAERDDDLAHVGLARDEEGVADNEPASPGELLDEEAIEDLALVQASIARFADEFSAGVMDDALDRPLEEERQQRQDDLFDDGAEFDQEATPARVHRHDTEDEDDHDDGAAAGGFVVHERPSPAMLPLAIALIVGLLIGSLGTYAVLGGGTREAVTDGAATATPPPPADTSKPAAAAGKAYSEQTVAPSTQAAAPPEPVPEAPAAPSTGRLVVASTPTGAGVTVDGEWRGRTPLTLDKLPLGAHVVRVVQPGYSAARQDVTLTPASSSRTLSFRLQRARGATAPERGRQSSSTTGSLYVDSKPRGARVFVDGRAAGVTPVRIPSVRAGSHTVRLELANHRAWTSSVRVSAGQQARVTGSLERNR